MLVKKIRNRLMLHTSRIKLHWMNKLLKRGRFDNNDRVTKIVFDDEWEERIKNVLNCKYNALIPRVSNAGNISDGFQTMHNGLKISTGDYYGLPIAKMLYLNKGVHEPEEEKMFMDVLARMPANPLMIEMGAYWAFYSMWFLRSTTNGRVYMIEPEKENLEVGKRNFRENKLEGSFDNYFIAERSSAAGITPAISVDDFVAKKNITHIDIAHADIQGFELEMLHGATKTLGSGMIDYFFISTHTNDLHYKCIDELTNAGYKVIFDLDMDHVASFDGFMLAVSPLIAQKENL